MKTTFKTESGSEYVIDHEVKTWERKNSNSKSGKLRTASGTFSGVSDITVGKAAVLVMAPLPESHPDTLARFIRTSPVTEITKYEA
jgi:hypothetical protein